MRALLPSLLLLAGVVGVVNGCNCGENLGGVPGNLAGRVCDPDSGQPLVGAGVAIDGPVHRESLSDATGGFSFLRIPSAPAGKYHVTATLGAVKREFDAPEVKSGDTGIPADDPACRPLPPDGSVGNLDGQVCNRHTGDFVKNADVILQLAGNLMVTHTDDNGNFSLPGVPEGTYVVEIRGDGFQRAFQVTIVAGQTFTLNLADDCSPVSATEGGVVGSFCDPNTQGNLIGADVTISPAGGAAGETTNDVTDTNGTFEVNGLAPGSYQVDVNLQGVFGFTSVVTVVAGELAQVTDPSECADRPVFGRVEGQICDTEAGGRFVGDVDLIRGVTLIASTVSDSEGRFAFNSVAPDTYTVKAHKPPSFERIFSGVVVDAFRTTFIQESSCPQPQDLCSEFVNQPQVSSDGRIMLIVDKSGSMGDNGTDGAQKWTSLKGALENVTQTLTATVEFGLMLFPLRGGDVCQQGSQILPLARNNAGQIRTELEATNPGGGTPTAATLAAARNLLAPSASDGRPLAVLLATDGGPNCNDSLDGNGSFCRCTNLAQSGSCGVHNCLDDVNTVSAVGQIKDLGVDVFVLGLPGVEDFSDVLNQMATVGGGALPGATKYYETNDAAALQSALDEITHRLLTCRVDIATTDLSAVDSITVKVGTQILTRDQGRQNGWDVTGTHTVQLFGSACDIASASADNVTVQTCVSQ